MADDLGTQKKWQKQLRCRRKTVWKGVGRGGSRLLSTKQVKHRAMLQGGIWDPTASQPAGSVEEALAA